MTSDAALAALAERATPGPWRSEPGLDDETSRRVVAGPPVPAHGGYPALIGEWAVVPMGILDVDGDFIAACSPDAILALIRRAQEAEAALAVARGALGQVRDGLTEFPAVGLLNAMRQTIDAALSSSAGARAAEVVAAAEKLVDAPWCTEVATAAEKALEDAVAAMRTERGTG